MSSSQQNIHNINQINHQRVKYAFESLGYSQRDYINFEDLHQTLNKLSNQQFDQNIFEQLWQQCKLNSQGQTKISNFIDNIIRAQAILIQKQKETTLQIKNIEMKLNSQIISNSDKIQINAEYNQLMELRSSFIIDLEIIRKPFTKFMMETIVKPAGAVGAGYNLFQNQQIQSHGLNSLPIPISNKKNLAWIFYLSFIGIIAQVLVYLYLNAFMNSVLFLLILSLFFFQHFDRKTIRFLLVFTCYTLIVDIIWYIISAKTVWNIHQIGMWPQFLSGYLKFSVILISCVFLIKAMIAILLCSQYNIDESQPQQIDICGKIFILKSDNPNAPLKRILDQFTNKPMHQTQVTQPQPAG